MFCGWPHRISCECRLCRDIHNNNFARRCSRRRTRNRGKKPKGEEPMKKPQVGMNGANVKLLRASAFSQAHPHIWDYLTAPRYSDTKELRQTSTLLLFNDSGVLKLCFSDKDNNRTVFMTGETVEELFTNLEVALESDTAEWRTSRSANHGSKNIPY